MSGLDASLGSLCATHDKQAREKREKTLFPALKPVVLGVLVASLATGCSVFPETLKEGEVQVQAANDLLNLTRDQEPVTKPVSLYEAMARALKYNLDFRLEMMEKVLAQEQLKLFRYDMLPEFVTNFGYNARDKFSGASSSAILSADTIGGQTLGSSTSSDRDVFELELGITWNILDFGVSYFRAKQAADRVMMAEEQKRRVVNRIVQDVRTAYWRAVGAERLKERIRLLRGRVRGALMDSKRVIRGRLDAPMNQLTYQRELLSIKRQLEELQRNLMLAKVQLAALMNVRPDEEYELVLPDRTEEVQEIQLRTDELEKMALEWRPELRELAYEKRVNAKETKAALLELMPGVQLGVGKFYNNNSFLFNNNWINLSSQVAWNLLDLVRLPQKLREVETQGKVLDAQRLALSMAVLTQVNVSLAQYGHAKQEYETAVDYHKTQNAIIGQVKAGASVNRISEQALIREEMNTLLADVRYDVAYSDLENAYAGVYAAVGVDPVPGDTHTDSIGELTEVLQAHWGGLDTGR